MTGAPPKPSDCQQPLPGAPVIGFSDLLGAPTAKHPLETEGVRRIETKKAGRRTNIRYGEFAIRLERARIAANKLRDEIEEHHDAIAMNPTCFRGLLAQLALTSRNAASELAALLETTPST